MLAKHQKDIYISKKSSSLQITDIIIMSYDIIILSVKEFLNPNTLSKIHSNAME